MAKLVIDEVPIKDKKVFIRVDFNVPLDEQGRITDDTRIKASLPTIRYALQEGARVILASHLGRPKGKPDPKLSLCPVAERLKELLGTRVIMAPDCIGPEVRAQIDSLQPGEVILLENLRFHKGEEANDEGFARELASLADLYVNDAFGSAHRAHASTQGITRFLPLAVAGFLMQAELNYLGRLLEDPESPFITILGGAKVSDKLGIIKNLLDRVDILLIGGGMAYTFLLAQGKEVGTSLTEPDRLDQAREIMSMAQEKGVKFILPPDSVAAKECRAEAEARVMPMEGFAPDWMALDIGPQTITAFSQQIAQAKTIFWNGPMGVFELPKFSNGTMSIAREVARSGATSVIGGGDTVAAVRKAGVAEKITHISTGGGASLEFLEGRVLPGVAALRDK